MSFRLVVPLTLAKSPKQFGTIISLSRVRTFGDCLSRDQANLLGGVQSQSRIMPDVT